MEYNIDDTVELVAAKDNVHEVLSALRWNSVFDFCGRLHSHRQPVALGRLHTS